jgi:hypothetical protein
MIQKANSDTTLAQKDKNNNFSVFEENNKENETEKEKERYFENNSSTNLLEYDSTRSYDNENKENRITLSDNITNLNNFSLNYSKSDFDELKINNMSFNCQQKNSHLEKIYDLRNNDLYKNYFFNREELDKVKIDVTFMEINSNNVNSKDQTQLAVEFTKNYVKKFPEIEFIIKILKRLLQIQNLNNSFNGKFILIY